MPIDRQSMAGEFAIIHPPSRLGTSPYRALVPRLSAGMASVMTWDWHRIGGLTWIDTDWQIGKFVSEPKIDPRLAQDWHGLARIGTDWHGLARIGKLANLCRNKKLAPDWHRIGMD